jgi:hypothetical protein
MTLDRDIIYPESNGKPMADNTEQVKKNRVERSRKKLGRIWPRRKTSA